MKKTESTHCVLKVSLHIPGIIGMHAHMVMYTSCMHGLLLLNIELKIESEVVQHDVLNYILKYNNLTVIIIIIIIIII